LVDRIRTRARSERGHGWCYAADELFLLAGHVVPGAEYYDAWPLLENGVGAVRSLLDAFAAGRDRLGPIRGVDAVRIVTGSSMAPFFESMRPDLHAGLGCRVELAVVENAYFGPTVTVAGLLAGEDIAGTLGPGSPGELILVPGEALNDDGVFIDGMALDTLRDRLAPARVEPGLELVELLTRVGRGRAQ